MTSFPIQPNYANHILVASPSNVVRQRVLENLRSPARRFEQATGGAEALVHLESGFWQVLFLDRRLPDLDSEELSTMVRQRFPEIEVVLLDADSDAEPNAVEEPRNQPSEMWLAVSTNQDKEDGKNEREKNEDWALTPALGHQSVLEAPLPGMIGNSRIIQPVYRLVCLLAPQYHRPDHRSPPVVARKLLPVPFII